MQEVLRLLQTDKIKQADFDHGLDAALNAIHSFSVPLCRDAGSAGAFPGSCVLDLFIVACFVFCLPFPIF